ncbi:hypothetical protein PU560_11075, partial [Georgenia sp. 10Sc9-8]|nr:hypothetical protein [Georgenia halotolerans]
QAEHAEDLAQKAARKLDGTSADAESAAATDVDENTEAEVKEHPSGTGAGRTEATGDGAPMP